MILFFLGNNVRMWLSSYYQLNTICHHLTICVHLENLVREYLSSFLFQGISSFRNRDPQGIQIWRHVGSTLAKHNFRKKEKYLILCHFTFAHLLKCTCCGHVCQIFYSLCSLGILFVEKLCHLLAIFALAQFTQDSIFSYLSIY